MYSWSKTIKPTYKTASLHLTEGKGWARWQIIVVTASDWNERLRPSGLSLNRLGSCLRWLTVMVSTFPRGKCECDGPRRGTRFPLSFRRWIPDISILTGCLEPFPSRQQNLGHALRLPLPAAPGCSARPKQVVLAILASVAIAPTMTFNGFARRKRLQRKAIKKGLPLCPSETGYSPTRQEARSGNSPKESLGG